MSSNSEAASQPSLASSSLPERSGNFGVVVTTTPLKVARSKWMPRSDKSLEEEEDEDEEEPEEMLERNC